VADGQELMDCFKGTGWSWVNAGQVAVVAGMTVINPYLGGMGGAVVGVDWLVESTMRSLLFKVADNWLQRAQFVNAEIQAAIRDAK